MAGGRFEWTIEEELAVGPVRPQDLAAALDSAFRVAEASSAAGARAALTAAFPRASAKIGLLLHLETLELRRDADGATSLAVYLHGAAGELADADSGEVSMTAVDLVEHIGDAVLELTARRRVAANKTE